MSIGNPRWPPPEDKLNIGSHGENVLNLLLSKISKLFDSKQDWNIPWIGHLQNVCLFCLSEIQNGSITAGYSFNRGSYGKMESNFSQIL